MDKQELEKLKLEIEHCRERLQQELSNQDSRDNTESILHLSQELDKLIVKYTQLLKDFHQKNNDR